MRFSKTMNGRLGLALLVTALITALSAGAYAQTFAPAPAATPAAATQPGAAKTPTILSDVPVDPLVAMTDKEYRGEKISLDFQNADIHNILRLIGEVSGMNVVVSDQVSGKVTLKLKNVPWDQALDIVLASKNLGYIAKGNVLRVDSMPNIRQAFPDPSDPTAKIALDRAVFTPKYSSVSALATELDKYKSLRGRVRVIGNDIYVEDDPLTLKTLKEIFARNDKVTKQILIEARIVEATNDFTQNLGIRWGGYGGHNSRPSDLNGDTSMSERHASGQVTGLPASTSDAQGFAEDSAVGGMTGFLPGEHFGVLDVGGSQAMKLGYGFLNRSGTMLLNAELSVNEALGETKTISAPRIMASNDNEVYIKQGTQVPYQTTSADEGTKTDFKDALMELRVKPHIEENGQIISLDITLTKDSIGNQINNGEPTIDKKEAKTKLMVRDGETVVIGGIIEDKQSTTSTRVPGLHAIPLLGWLFQDRGVGNTKRELLVFITANIIPLNI